MKLTKHQQGVLKLLKDNDRKEPGQWTYARSKEVTLGTTYALKELGLVETRSEIVKIRDTARGHMIIGRNVKSFCEVELRLTEKGKGIL